MAGDESLDSYYDAVVLGTGLAESILAAALARAGKTVLHLDHVSELQQCRN
jgi:Rab proteins geranylgeranyltransferase component A